MYVYKISLRYKRTLHNQEQNKLSKNYEIPDGSCSRFFGIVPKERELLSHHCLSPIGVVPKYSIYG